MKLKVLISVPRKIVFYGTLFTLFMLMVYCTMRFSSQFATLLTPGVTAEERESIIDNTGIIGTLGTLLQLAISAATYLVIKKVENPNLDIEHIVYNAIRNAFGDLKKSLGLDTSLASTSNVSRPTRVSVNDEALKRLEGLDIQITSPKPGLAVFNIIAISIWFCSFAYAIPRIDEYRNTDIYMLTIYVAFSVTLLLCVPLAFANLKHRNSVSEFRNIVLDSLRKNATVPGIVFSSRPLNARLEMIRLCSSDVGKVHEFWPACAAIDNQAIDSRYTFISVMNWTLPVLGFVGTAHGLSVAVVDFQIILKNSDFTINASLIGGSVIPALAASFLSTISALLATVSTYICMSALKSNDRSNLEEIDRTCLELLTAIEAPGTDLELQLIAKELASISKKWSDISSGVDSTKETVSRLENITGVVEDVVDSMKSAAQDAAKNSNDAADQVQKAQDITKEANSAAERMRMASDEISNIVKLMSRQLTISQKIAATTYQMNWNSR